MEPPDRSYKDVKLGAMTRMKDPQTPLPYYFDTASVMKADDCLSRLCGRRVRRGFAGGSGRARDKWLCGQIHMFALSERIDSVEEEMKRGRRPKHCVGSEWYDPSTKNVEAIGPPCVTRESADF